MNGEDATKLYKECNQLLKHIEYCDKQLQCLTKWYCRKWAGIVREINEIESFVLHVLIPIFKNRIQLITL